ncbi:MAG: hypothetical protein CSA81_04920 [Acidobacteria bacterium]|nr:MAG: hypothetical protein CSA81_04920 [Acidobacteriota bacterium]
MDEILQSLPDPMKLDESVWFIVVVVLVSLLILNKFVFKPLVAVLDERETKIKEGIKMRESSLKTVEESLEAYQSRLTAARKEAHGKRLKILRESQEEFEKTMTEVKQSAASSVKKAVEEMSQQVSKAKADLEKETAKLTDQIVSSVLNNQT